MCEGSPSNRGIVGSRRRDVGTSGAAESFSRLRAGRRAHVDGDNRRDVRLLRRKDLTTCGVQAYLRRTSLTVGEESSAHRGGLGNNRGGLGRVRGSRRLSSGGFCLDRGVLSSGRGVQIRWRGLRLEYRGVTGHHASKRGSNRGGEQVVRLEDRRWREVIERVAASIDYVAASKQLIAAPISRIAAPRGLAGHEGPASLRPGLRVASSRPGGQCRRGHPKMLLGGRSARPPLR